MQQHQFTLEPYKGPASRTLCPKCQRKEFSNYIDTATGERLHPTVGRCNRESKCAYHYKPKQYFEDHNILKTLTLPTTHQSWIEKPKVVSYIPIELFKASLQCYEVNHFAQYLANLWGTEKANEALGRYFIGTSKHWEGATVFPLIDLKGKIRTGKIMLYSPITGKRIRESYDHITWVHSLLKQPNFEKELCLFGEHLLKEPLKPVAIVESEKTAVIASVYIPKFIWLATGGKSNLNASRLEVLKGRQVFLFPDLKEFDYWSNKAKELSHLATFTVSDLLERTATDAERIEGFDLADYLVKLDYREFKQPQAAALEAVEPETRVVNIYSKEKFEVYIGNKNLKFGLAGSKWGNPFPFKILGRELAIALYRVWITEGEGKHLLNDLHELKGKVLCCYCKPQPCHGDTLIELIENNGKLSKPLNWQPINKEKLLVKHYNEPQPESWEQEISELEKFFATVTLPASPIKLNPHSTIIDCFKFVQSHLATVRANNGKPTFKPYLNRLKELKSVLNN
jgi:hypothetical protein